MIEEQGYYESEDDLDEDDFDSESTHFTDSSDGEEYEEDEDMISVPQVGFDDNVNMETQQEQLMESISENVEGGFFVTSGIGSRGNNHNNNNNNSKGMIPSSSAPQLGAKSKKSPYIVA